MSEEKSIRLAKAAKELNVSVSTIIEHLGKQGHKVESNPNTKLSEDLHNILLRDFKGDIQLKEEAHNVSLSKLRKEDKVEITESTAAPKAKKEIEQEEILIKNVSVTDESLNTMVDKPTKAPAEKIKSEKIALEGTKVVGKVDLQKGKKSNKEEIKEVEIKETPIKEKPKKEEVQKIETKKAAELPGLKVVKNVEISKENKTEKGKTKLEVEKKSEEKPIVKEVEKEKIEEIKKEINSKEKISEPIVKEKEDEVNPGEAVSDDETKDRHTTKYETLSGPKILGNIVLPINAPKKKQPVASSNQDKSDQNRKKRKRKGPERPVGTPSTPGAPRPPGTPGSHGTAVGQGGQRPYQGRPDGPRKFEKRGTTPVKPVIKAELTEKEVQDQIKATLARLSGAGKSGKFAQRSKLRRQKRDDIASAAEEAMMEKELQSKILKVTEFVTANQLAQMMEVPVNKIISTCMSLGMFVSINQRLDAESLSLVAEEFGFEIEFVKVDDQEIINEEIDKPEDLLPRAPIVTVMGHVDHGKTSLLDYVRKANVIAGEAGGITQHIGAYEVTLENGRKISFLDTPGHEAFTAMRARGAKVTDVAIIVISADDSVMPQTVEAINHAQAAGVPIVFAFNKIDKDGANPNKIREQLSAMNILVEDWGGKYQCQEISAKKGLNVELLLEKVCLEADLLELKANPNKLAQGTVIEAMLDKGRGIITTVLVQSGTLKIGDPILAGCFSGRVKALYNERGQRIETAGPSAPVQVLGMQGAPQAGDKFNAMESEVAARDIANKRLQLSREQGMRSQKHITLDEIGRRLAIGNFKELNVIVKGDVDGSVEALADSLLKLSTPEIQVNVVHKAVGQISESDVLLASASDAIIIGFQVRPSLNARKIAEQEEIDIRMYSIIYDAINELKSAMEGMLAPTIEDKVVCNVEIREVFKITKVGTIAGCMVTDGKIHRNTKVRIIRDGVVIHTGELESLKRFKDDAKEVSAGLECGLNIKNFNEIEAGDTIEGYEQVEVKRKLGAK